MDNETVEETYTTKDLAKDVGKAAVVASAEVVAAYAALAAIGYTYIKVVEFRDKRKAKKNQEQ